MTDVEQLRRWFDDGTLDRPDPSRLNFVDLARAIGAFAGVRDVDQGAGVGRILSQLKGVDQCVFVLIDGLGETLLAELPPEAFLIRRRWAGLQSVFLSTTATALTSLGTGEWPCANGVPGWWTYLAHRNLNVVNLPFVERLSEEDLHTHGVTLDELFPTPSMWGRMGRSVHTVVPRSIAGSVYSLYATGAMPYTPYDKIGEALATVRQAVDHGTSLTYLYLPQLDRTQHQHGPSAMDSFMVLSYLDVQLGRLADELPPGVRMIICADHGQIDVATDRKIGVPANDPLLDLLCGLPSGEPAVPVFHVRPGAEKAFGAMFAERFPETFLLITPDEVEALELMGPGRLSGATRDRLGTYVGIAQQPVVFEVLGRDGTGAGHLGTHGGLRPQEMRTPLIIA